MALYQSFAAWVTILVCAEAVVKIGVPGDYVDKESCFDRACISERHWSEIGNKWQNFKETAGIMDKSNSSDIREAIWRAFQSGSLWGEDSLSREASLQDLKQMKHRMDEETTRFREFQPKDAFTRYEHQAIIAMETDITVEKAAYYLYNKNLQSSTLYQYNPVDGTLTRIAGEDHYLGKGSRIQIVGHGRDTTGVMKLSDNTPEELAKIVRKLPVKGSEIGRVSLVGCNIGSPGQTEYLNAGYTERFLQALYHEQGIKAEVSARHGLVSVTASGRKETGEITPDGIQWFTKDPLSKSIVKFGEFGEIVRVEIPLTERIPTFSEDSSGSLVKIRDIDPTDSLNNNIKPLYIEKTEANTGSLQLMKKMAHRDINNYIDTVTESTFFNDQSYIHQKIFNKNENIVKIKQAIESMSNKQFTGPLEISMENMMKRMVKLNGRYQYNQFEGDLNLLDKVSKNELSSKYRFKLALNDFGDLIMSLGDGPGRKVFPLETDTAGKWAYVARLDEGTRQKVYSTEQVRTVGSKSDLINEINMLGTFGIYDNNGNTFNRYYRFGDVLYRMSSKNFYIEWEGMIASDSSVLEPHKGKLVKETDILRVKPWIWKNRANQDTFPDSRTKTAYPDMMVAIEDSYVDAVIDKAIADVRQNTGRNVQPDHSQTVIHEDTVLFTLKEGTWSTSFRTNYHSEKVLRMMELFTNGQQAEIRAQMSHVLEGSTSLAVALSEPVRNYRSFFINEILIHLNKQEAISLQRLIKIHPMTRGRSWGDIQYTGLTRYQYNNNQLTLVLPRELNIARTFLLSRQGADNAGSQYRFITEGDYRVIERRMPTGELARLTTDVTFREIQNTVADFIPDSIEPVIRTKPLGSPELTSVSYLAELSEFSDIKSLPIRASASVAYDYVRITNHVSKIIAEKSQVSGRKFQIIESSIKVEDGYIKFKVRDPSRPTSEENVSVKDEPWSSTSVKEDTNEKINKIEKGPSKALLKVNSFLGVYGSVLGFRGAVQCFEEGQTFEGIMNIVQSVHGLVSLSTTAQKAFEKITSKILTKGLQLLERGLTAVSTGVRSALAIQTVAAQETTAIATAGKVAGDIPILGTVFGIYNTVQDLRRGTAIGYVDAALDAAIMISAFFGPEALVVTVALTVVRLVIDDFYYAISNAIERLPPNATTLQKIGAVLEGIVEGLVMVIKNILDFFSLGLLSFIETASKIDEQYRKDHEFFDKMSDYHNYFNIERQEGSSNKLIDFASGEASWNGGNIVFRLFDDNTARLQMQIIDDEGQQQYLDKDIYLGEGANDIVLGIGESHDISFKKYSAKILWFIPVHSRYLVDNIRGERETLHGTYYGNSRNNKFFAVQKLPEGKDIGYTLADYFYELYGQDGDDIFYLGPQKSTVNGGNGHDVYIIPETGGATVIDNYATDLKEDVLFVQVDFNKLSVDRIGNNLLLRHGNNHDITVRDWFSGHRKGHMTFKANQGVIFNVTLGVYGRPALVPLAIIRIGEKNDYVIDVSAGIWENVVLITGSDGSDTIIANGKDNLINGGKGQNIMKGGKGSDTYILASEVRGTYSDWNTINNYDEAMVVDKVLFDIPFRNIHADKQGNDVKLYSAEIHGPKVALQSWFVSEHYRHMLFVTSDDIIFKVTDDINDPNIKQPIIMDGAKEKAGVKFDASPTEYKNISTIIGSDFDDILIGNDGNNHIKGGVGKDKVMGGMGRDVYVVRPEDIGDIINNFSEDIKDDLLLADFKYDDIETAVSGYDLYLTKSGQRIVTVENWLKGEQWQHLVVRTIDGISFRLKQDGSATVTKMPVEVDKSGQINRQVINTNRRSLNSVEIIVGSNSTDYLSGNTKSNRIDPGYGGAYMLGLDGHDQYIFKGGYHGPNVINNFAQDGLTDLIKLPDYFQSVQVNVSDSNIIIFCNESGVQVTVENYLQDDNHRHLLIRTLKDGVEFTLPPEMDYQPVPISVDRKDQAHNLIVDLESDNIWNNVITVIGTLEHSNVLIGNNKNNTLSGGRLSDTLEGMEGNDVIRGEEGEDFIDGGDGDDTLVGGAGNDWIYGGMGDDIIYPGPGSDHVNGGPGFDVVVLFGDPNNTTGVFVDLLNGHGYEGDAAGDVFVSIEGVIGGFYSDILVGDNEDNYLSGKENNDILIPSDGIDILIGGEGKDIYDIDTAKGEKMISNKARDGLMDRVNLRFYDKKSVYLERRANDLVIHVGFYMEGIFCPKPKIGPFHVQDWYQDRSYQHIIVELQDTDLILDEFNTGGVEVTMQRPDTTERKRRCDQLFKEGLKEYDYYDYYP